jgi:hypothetical protein
MEYTPQLAQPFIGKRVIVSICHIATDGAETFSGLWGVISSVHEGGLLLQVEGGIDDEFWMLPPDLDALVPAKQEAYRHDGYDEQVVDVDYEAYFCSAESPEDLKIRTKNVRP